MAWTVFELVQNRRDNHHRALEHMANLLVFNILLKLIFLNIECSNKVDILRVGSNFVKNYKFIQKLPP